MSTWDPRFRLQRFSLLQPNLQMDELDKRPERSAERVVLDAYGNIVRAWAGAHREIPGGRLEGKFEVTSAARQPVCELSVETQIIRRRVEQREEPASRTTADERPLPTGTPLRIVPIEDVAFPATAASHTHRLPGGETIRPCGPCGAEGHLPCSACGQTGRVACSSCAGAKRTVCPACSGQGRQRLANGMIVNCGSCLANGFRVCTACDADGQVRCSGCGGQGFITCARCQGYGRLCTFFVLVSEVSTEHSRVTHQAEAWEVDVDGLCGDMQPLWAEDVPLSLPASGQPAVYDVDAFAPDMAPGALAHVRAALAAALARGSVLGPSAETARAVRLSLRGCYLHRVGYRLDGGKTESHLYIGGLNNRVAPGSLLARCRTSSVIVGVQKPVHRILSWLGVVEDSGPAKSFGKGHPLDAKGVVVEAIKQRQFACEVTDEGYQIGIDGATLAVVELTHDEARGDLIVSLVCPLGPARREKFVDALRFNGAVDFGRVGLVVDPVSGALGFTLFDIRPYADLDTPTYATILDHALKTVRPDAIARLVD